MEKECNHNYKHLRQESSHEGACYHTGSCLIDIFYCTKCGQKTRDGYHLTFPYNTGTDRDFWDAKSSESEKEKPFKL